MAKKWYMREYQNGDEKGIIEIRKEVFADDEIEKQSFDYWKWEFMDNPNGKAEIMLAFNKDDDLLIGHQAYIHHKFNKNNQVIKGSLSCDSMTRKKYRYPFMFYTIDNQCCDNLKKDGIHFKYGFGYRSGMKELSEQSGNKILGYIPIYVLPVNSSNIIKKYIKINALSFIFGLCSNVAFSTLRKLFMYNVERKKIEIVEKFDESFDDLWEQCKNQHNIMQYRDYENLKWRFEDNPKVKYTILKCLEDDKLVGYMVLRNTNIFGLKCLIICDVLALDIDHKILANLDNAAVEYAKKNSCDLVGLMLQSHKGYSKYFKQKLYIKSPFKFSMSFGYICLEEQVVINDFYITWMDSDTI